MWNYIRKLDWLALAVLISIASAETIVVGAAVYGSPLPTQHQIQDQPKSQTAPDTDDGSASTRAEERTADYTRALAVWTALLVLVAAGQAIMFGFQLLYMRRGMEDTKAAAEAAKAAANAAKDSAELAKKEFITTHRPKIGVRGVKFAGVDAGLKEEIISFVCRNEGESRATIISVSTAFIPSSATESLPGEPVFIVQKVSIPLLIGADVTLETPSPVPFDAGTRLGVAAGTWGAFFVGVVAYEDDTGVMRETGFARRCDTELKWKPYDDDEYEYSY